MYLLIESIAAGNRAASRRKHRRCITAGRRPRPQLTSPERCSLPSRRGCAGQPIVSGEQQALDRMADKWTAPRPDADEVPYWGVNDSFEEEGDDADADLDADGRKKLTVRQQCLRLFSLVIFVVLFPFVVIALGAYRAASVVRGLYFC